MREAFYLDNEQERKLWLDTKTKARELLIKPNNDVVWRKYEQAVKSPLQATKPDGDGIFGGGISRPTETVALMHQPPTDYDKMRWAKALTQLERQLTQQEIMVLQTWRTPIKHGKDKESVCYNLFGETWAYETMKGIIRELSTRLAAMFLMCD